MFLGTEIPYIRFEMFSLLLMKIWRVLMKYGNNLIFIMILLQQFLFLGYSRKTSSIECITLVQRTLAQKINRCSSSLSRPLVPFRLRKWEKKKRMSQEHLSL
jgi:hypothetical protein